MKKKVKIGINGFGRIGRLILRIASERDDVEVVGINDPFIDADYAAYMLKFDTVHGKFNGEVYAKDGKLVVNGKKIDFYSEYEPAHINWNLTKPDVVAEASGKYTLAEEAEKHIGSGAKKVVITAAGKGCPMFVMGVNSSEYDPSMKVVSNSSCTTNCLAPLAKVIHENFGIKEGLMTTVHSLTQLNLKKKQPMKKLLKQLKKQKTANLKELLEQPIFLLFQAISLATHEPASLTKKPELCLILHLLNLLLGMTTNMATLANLLTCLNLLAAQTDFPLSYKRKTR